MRAAGKEEQATELKRHIQEMEEQLARLDRPGAGQPRPARERLARRAREAGDRGPADPEQRMKHIQIAIENLHAAGMHEAADRVAQQAHSMPREFLAPGRLQDRRPQGLPEGDLSTLEE